MTTMTDAPVAEFAATNVYLGPATVGRIARGRVLLAFPDQKAWATLALATPYQPTAGDVVLAISQGEHWYVIGVVSGKGLTSLSVPGDLDLRAPRGEIRLSAAQGVKIKSSLVSLTAEKLEVAAVTVTERFKRARRRVAETYTIAAGGIKAVAERTLRMKAKRVVQRAEQDVTIDGDKVKLG